MAVGDSIKLDFKTERDPDTGASVRKLSPDGGDTLAPYFTQNMTSADGDLVLVASSVTGSWQVHFIDLRNHRMVQASRELGVSMHAPAMDANGRVAYYWAGRVLRKVDFATLRGEALYEAPEGFHGSNLSIDASGRYLAFAYMENVNLSTTTSENFRSGMVEHLYRHPTCVVVRFDLREGRPEAVWGERQWITHVNISPVNPDLVLFCHEGPWDRVQRMWVARASTGECWPVLNRKKFVEQDGHEFFTGSGRVVTQFGGRAPEDGTWREFCLMIDPEGTNEDRYAFPASGQPVYLQRPAHIQAAHKDESLLVGDASFPVGEEDRYGRSFMSLLRLTDDRKVAFKPLCKHDTSWTSQESHPHPFFAPDDSSVFFNSDRGGSVNLYQVPDLEAFRGDF